MGKVAISFLLVFFLYACVQHTSPDSSEQQSRRRGRVKIEQAKGFDVVYRDKYIKIITHSIRENSFFRDSLYLLQDEMPQKFTAARKIVPAQWTSICCQSSTHLAFINQLKKMQLVKGVCGLNYVSNEEIKNKLQANKAIEVCIGENSQTEALLAQNPDIYLTYPFSSEQNEKLEKSGVNTFMIAEYLELDPISRLEWIKLFGVLFHKEKEATTYFNQVKASYDSLKFKYPTTKSTFFMNLPFGDNWFAPSGNSLIVSLLEDAGLNYYYKYSSGTENQAHPIEEIWDLGAKLEYWVIIADRPKNYSMEDLIAENEVYATFKSVQHHQVIFCNTATTDYFIQGVLEPDVMLKDILHAKNEYPDHEPVYFHLLN